MTKFRLHASFHLGLIDLARWSVLQLDFVPRRSGPGAIMMIYGWLSQWELRKLPYWVVLLKI